ncbi:FxLD family lanthipeptide [Actinomadura rudentiformis]|uniref:FxLD family lantipeptide n=1 Tax=Actinomadura rudentiformis TaxID=359158 RepID=A0A6H9YFN5_9ACTN|nr:FxLD family lanthipeptide [Actinomadura rudentiformis]KAB2344840.1 FxLD family lantipeptide [Actinomadura rudentiformis]
MTARTDTTSPSTTTPADEQTGPDPFELDITIVEAGPEADRLIRMTDDGCGKTCQSACPNTC